jgi:hypothetical protein
VTDLAPGGGTVVASLSVDIASVLLVDPGTLPDFPPDDGFPIADSEDPETSESADSASDPTLATKDGSAVPTGALLGPLTGSTQGTSGALQAFRADESVEIRDSSFERSFEAAANLHMRKSDVDDGAADPMIRPGVALPEFLLSLDEMRRDVLDGEEAGSERREGLVPAIETFALAASTGLLTALLRAGSLVAMAISSVPIWKSADSLTILSLSDDERRDLEANLRDAGVGERDLERVLDGGAEDGPAEDNEALGE